MHDGREMLVVFEDSTRRVAADLVDALERAGYERPAPQPGRGFMTGTPASGFCGDSGIVNVESLGGAQRYMARVSYRRLTPPSRCGGGVENAPVKQLNIPALTAPSGTSLRTAGSGSGSNEVHSTGVLTGASVTPAAAVAHFASQLTAAGWVGAPPALSEKVVAQYFEARDERGALWSGTITATRYSNGMSVAIGMRLDNQR
jgi:hypothetical protein